MKQLKFVNLAELQDGYAPFDELGEEQRKKWGEQLRREPWRELGYGICRLAGKGGKGRIGG